MTKRSPSIRRSVPQGKNAPKPCKRCYAPMKQAEDGTYYCEKHGEDKP